MYTKTCEALKQKVCGDSCQSHVPLKSTIHTFKPSLLRCSFSARVSLRNLNKSISIGSGMEGLDGPCRAAIVE